MKVVKLMNGVAGRSARVLAGLALIAGGIAAAGPAAWFSRSSVSSRGGRGGRGMPGRAAVAAPPRAR